MTEVCARLSSLLDSRASNLSASRQECCASQSRFLFCVTSRPDLQPFGARSEGRTPLAVEVSVVRNLLRFSLLLVPIATLAIAQSNVTSPLKFFGHSVGEDYWLANYKQLSAYFKKVDSDTDRVKVVNIGKTEEGRDQLMAIVSSPANMRRLDRFRDISRKMAMGEPATKADAVKLAKEGKTIVWIDGGLHATEVLGAQQLIENLYYLASKEDEETKRILDDCIVLLVHANPDGMDLVSDWYMRKTDPRQRSTSGVPRLYQKYIGHDNNRDFYASTQAETTNMNRILYREWFPHVLYNHHQSAPAGTIIFAPPFRGPFSYHVDPLVQVSTDMVGMAMHQRFISEGKPGAVMRNAASYQTWWNGGLRTTAYFHNMVGILTEAFGSPTPSRVQFLPNRLVPSTDIPFPVEPQEWKFRQSIEYELTANYAILDYASRYRQSMLMNTYTMARNAIEKGKEDTWTFYPARVEAAGREGGMAALKDPKLRDPKGYILPADQTDFPTATKFVNTLIKTGVTVHRATEPFTVGGKRYASGSWIVKCDQPYRAHVLDMFEPQDYPNDFQYPGGPPIPPYDNAGYTPAFTMGVAFDRMLETFTGPFEPVSGLATPPAGIVVSNRGAPAGYLLDPAVNDSFAMVNSLLKGGVAVMRATEVSVSAAQPGIRQGTFFIPDGPGVRTKLSELAARTGVGVEGVNARPPNRMTELRPARIALYDRYGGSMPSGWTRWLFEQFGFNFSLVYPPEIDAGALAGYDVLVLPSDASFATGAAGGGAASLDQAPDSSIPEEWRKRMGRLTTASVAKIKEFLEAGGKVVAIGGSASLARALNLPVVDALTETVDGRERRLPRDKFYVPTSVLRLKFDPTHPAAWGMGEYADVLFDESPVFKLLPDADAAGLKRIAWFDTETPLRSGWAWGQKVLNGTIAAFEAPVGKGRLVVLGPEITFRAQPHGTFRLLFNALYGVRG